MARVESLIWHGGADGWLDLVDQRDLPGRLTRLRITSVEQVWGAIKELAVRGAPAIGIAGAYGLVFAARAAEGDRGEGTGGVEVARAWDRLGQAGAYLKSSRPTAVNLAWAVDRVLRAARVAAGAGGELGAAVLAEAQAIHREDAAMCAAIGAGGAGLIRDGMGVLTHCNTGVLATGGAGTALAMLYHAHEHGVRFKVFAGETRPLFQGARLTAWELQDAGIDVTLICDSMAGMVMAQKKVDLVVVGADRITARGDTANKIGTYGLAVLAKAHGIGFVVAAPSSTFDLSIEDGASIPIEERAGKEVSQPLGVVAAPEGVKVYNPSFDVTPAELIHAIVTERGVISPVTGQTIRSVLSGGRS